jgi:hypothetical protein
LSGVEIRECHTTVIIESAAFVCDVFCLVLLCVLTRDAARGLGVASGVSINPLIPLLHITAADFALIGTCRPVI